MRIAEELAAGLTEEDAYDQSGDSANGSKLLDEIIAHAKVLPGYAESIKERLSVGYRHGAYDPKKILGSLNTANRAIKQAYEALRAAESGR